MSSNACQFWMSNNAGTETFQFPVLPEKIQITRDAQNETVSVAGLGEITIIQNPAQKVYEWSAHFPAHRHQGSIENPEAPQKYVDLIEKWQASGKPPKFVITASDKGTKKSQVNTYCTIEGFTYHEEGGDPDTLYYTIQLKEYREIAVRTTKIKGKKPAKKTEEKTENQSGVVNVKKSSRLKLYKTKSKSSKVLVKMKNKDKVTVLSKSGSWYKVTHVKKKKTGFCEAKYIKIT